nr:hypothetical protein [Tanacetum cinerariifolium]
GTDDDAAIAFIEPLRLHASLARRRFAAFQAPFEDAHGVGHGRLVVAMLDRGGPAAGGSSDRRAVGNSRGCHPGPGCRPARPGKCFCRSPPAPDHGCWLRPESHAPAGRLPNRPDAGRCPVRTVLNAWVSPIGVYTVSVGDAWVNADARWR